MGQVGWVTDAERAELLEVARLLGVPAGEALAILEDTRDTPRQPSRHPGHDPARPRPSGLHRRQEHEQSRDRGTSHRRRTPHHQLSQRQDRASRGRRPVLPVRKANLARKLGVRMVTKQVFLHLLDHLQPAEEIITPT
jgi:hypothetical protein